MAKARLRRGIEIVKLANRIEALKMQEDETDEAPEESDVPSDPRAAASDALSGGDVGAGLTGSLTKSNTDKSSSSSGGGGKLSRLAKGAIFREVVLAKVRDMKEAENKLKVQKDAEDKAAKRKSFTDQQGR